MDKAFHDPSLHHFLSRFFTNHRLLWRLLLEFPAGCSIGSWLQHCPPPPAAQALGIFTATSLRLPPPHPTHTPVASSLIPGCSAHRSPSGLPLRAVGSPGIPEEVRGIPPTKWNKVQTRNQTYLQRYPSESQSSHFNALPGFLSVCVH